LGSRPEAIHRIADRRHPIWSGAGAALRGGRWNSPGRFVIYGSEHFSTARLELLVRLPFGVVPATHAVVRCSLPGSISIEEPDVRDLGPWNRQDLVASRAFGDRWYDERRSLVLVVPSLAALGERNLLVNERHPEFRRLRPELPKRVVWDPRLFARR
jgi:RES domain-containing protein